MTDKSEAMRNKALEMFENVELVKGPVAAVALAAMFEFNQAMCATQIIMWQDLTDDEKLEMGGYHTKSIMSAIKHLLAVSGLPSKTCYELLNLAGENHKAMTEALNHETD